MACVLTSGFRLLTNKTLWPPAAASPDRPSRLAAAAAAAMPVGPTPRDAKALGIPGTERPKSSKPQITLNSMQSVDKNLRNNLIMKIICYMYVWINYWNTDIRIRIAGNIFFVPTCLLNSKGWGEGMSATIGRGWDYTWCSYNNKI